MKKIKILFSAMAILVGSSVYSQTEAPADSKESTKVNMKDVTSKSKSFTAEMCKELDINDKGVIQTLASINENYEVTLLKTTTETEMSEAEIANLKSKLESSRMKRFKGILNPSQLKAYAGWKAKLDAPAAK